MANGNVLDREIVQMQFDNKAFDSNIQQSQKTLEEFKKTLNFEDVARQMQSFSQAMAVLPKMATDIGALASRLTGFGSINDFVVKKIRETWESAANGILNFGKSLTTVQEHAGFTKYDGLLQAVQTIKNATGDAESYVYGVMQDLNDYTDETSYDFADMAKNISKFTTAGVNLKDAELEMEGIANWAAFAGQGVQEAQRAMYNISQAMSAGYMKLMDYRSIQNASMDIRKFREEAIKAAVAVGTLTEKNGKFFTKTGNKEVNLDNFTDTLQFKWFDRATMEKVFKTFGDNEKGIGEEAYKAAQRCIKFSDALNAIKDMLSTGWMKTYEHIFGQLTDAMNLFSGLCLKASDALEKFVTFRNDLLERWSLGGGRDSLWSALVGELETPDGETLFKGAYGLLDMLTGIGDLISDAFISFVSNFVGAANLDDIEEDPSYALVYLSTLMDEMTDKLRDFIGSIKTFFDEIPVGSSESRLSQIQHVVEGLYAAVLLVLNVYSGIRKFATSLLSQLQPSFDVILSLLSYISQLFTGSVVESVKNDYIGKWFVSLAESMRPLTTAVNTIVGFLARLIASIASFAKQSGLIDMIGQALNGFVSVLSQFLGWLLHADWFKKFVDTISQGFLDLGNQIRSLRSSGKSIKDVIKQLNFFKPVMSKLISIFGKDGLNAIWNSISTLFTNITTKLPETITAVKNQIQASLGNGDGIIKSIISGILGMFTKSAGAEGVSGELKDAVVQEVKNAAEDVVDNVTDAIVDAVSPTDDGKGIFAKLQATFAGVFSKIKDFFKNLFEKTIPEIFQNEHVQNIKKIIAGDDWSQFYDRLIQFMKLWASIKWGAGIGKIGAGIGSFGKGIKAVGKGFSKFSSAFKVFSKNMKDFSPFRFVTDFKDSFNTKTVTKDLGKIGPALLFAAGAVYIIVEAMLKLKDVEPKDLLKPALEIVGILTVLLTASAIAKKISGGGFDLLGLAVAIYLLTHVLTSISKTEWPVLIDSLAKVMLIAMLLAMVAQASGNVNMKGFVGLAIAIGLLTGVVRELGRMDAGVAWSGISRLFPIFLMLAGLVAVAGLVKAEKISGLVGVAFAIVLLMIPIELLGHMKPEQAFQGVAYLVVIFGLIMALLNTSKDVEKASKVGGMVAAVAALAFVAFLLGQMKPEKALVGILAISAIMGMMALILNQTKKVSEKQLSKLQGIFTMLAVVVAVIAVAIGVLSAMGVQWEFVASFLGGLSAIILMIGLFLPALSKLDPLTAVKGIAILGAAIAVVVAVLCALAPMIGEALGAGISKFFDKIAPMAERISTFTSIMGGVSDGSISSMKDKFAALYDAFKTLGGFKDLAPAVDSFSVQMGNMRAGLSLMFYNDSEIPDFYGSHIYNALIGIRDLAPSLSGLDFGNLPVQIARLGAGLSLFSDFSADFPSSDDDSGLSFLTRLFGQADNIRTLTTLPLGRLNGQLTTLGGAMSVYAEGAGKFGTVDNPADPDKIKAAVDVLEAISTSISGSEIESGFKIPENMPDEGALATFGAELAALGGAMKAFIDGCNGINYNTDSGIAALTALGDLSVNLDKSKLEVAKVFGAAGVNSTTLGDFATDIKLLGKALQSFATYTTGKDFSNGTNALDSLAVINEKLTEANLEFMNVVGTENFNETILSEFSRDIASLGNALAAFATSVNYVDENGMPDETKLANFDVAIKAVELFGGIAEHMPKVGGLIEVFAGHVKTLDEFGLEIEKLGGSLKTFSEKLTASGIEATAEESEAGHKYSKQIEAALAVLEGLLDIQNQMPDETLVVNLNGLIWTHKENLDFLASGIKPLGEALSSFSKKLANSGLEASEEDEGEGHRYAKPIEAGLAVLEDLLTIQNKMPNETRVITLGGIIETHATGLDTIAAGIEPLGTALSGFSSSLTYIPKGDNSGETYSFGYTQPIRDALSVLNQLVGISNTLPKEKISGLKTLIEGHTQTLTTMSGDIIALGGALKSFSDALTGTEGLENGFNIEVVNGALNATSKLVEIGRMLQMTSESEYADGGRYGIGLYLNSLSDLFTMLNESWFGGDGEVLATKIANFMGKLSTAINQNGDIDVSKLAAFEDVIAGVTTLSASMSDSELQTPGQIISSGIAAGISSSSDLVIGAINSLMFSINSAIETGLNTTPTISPVLNMTEFEEDLAKYNFGGLDSEGASRSAGAAYTALNVNVLNPVDLNPVITAVNDVSTRVTELGNAIANIQIVLNTGIVAGGVSGEVDRRLGRYSFYDSRRNASSSP